MKYKVIGKQQAKLADSSFANPGDIVTDKQLGTRINDYLDLDMIEPCRASKAAKAESKTADVKSDEWSKKLSPREYLVRYPKGPHAKLAKKLVRQSTN